MGKYRQIPQQISTFPPGIPYIIGNELAERFSFYGMKAILMVFLTDYLLSASGELATMSEERGAAIVHLFVAVTYLTPLLGAIISDIFLGKFLTIVTLSLLYCFGHASLALMDIAPLIDMGQRPFLYAGLVMIAFGAGAIKPCVSAHVGDQFGTQNKHLVPKVFNWFYFSINVGAAVSTLLTPIFLHQVGPWLAFGVPGVLMGFATLVFWLGRHRFVHVPPAGWKNFKEEVLGRDGIRALINLAPIFLILLPPFWALFDQTASTWVSQAKVMNREVMGITLLPSQIQAVNPFLILILIPIFVYLVYPAMGKLFTPTPLRKISIGLFLMAVAFCIPALIELQIIEGAARASAGIWEALGMSGEEGYRGLRLAMDQVNVAKQELDGAAEAALDARVTASLSHMPSIGWQVLAYIVLTSAEVMVSITALEFAYTQAPRRMKSFIMGIFLASIFLGNAFTAAVNFFIDEEDEQRALVLRDDGTGVYTLEEQEPARLEWSVSENELVLTETATGQTTTYLLTDVTDSGFSYLDEAALIQWEQPAEDGEAPETADDPEEVDPAAYEEHLGGTWESKVDRGSKLEGASYFWFFTIVMAVTAVVFVIFSLFYRGRTYIQGEDEAAEDASLSEPELSGPHGEHGQHHDDDERRE